MSRPKEFDKEVSFRLDQDTRDALQMQAISRNVRFVDIVRHALMWSYVSTHISWEDHIEAFTQAKRSRRSTVAIEGQRRNSRKRRERFVAGFVEHVDRMRVYEASKGLCGICLRPVPVDDFAVDHIIPLAHGGLHAYANVQAAHHVCNSRKGSRIQ